MSKGHDILQITNSFFTSIAERIESVQEFKRSPISCFIAGDSHVKIISPHIAVFKENDII